MLEAFNRSNDELDDSENNNIFSPSPSNKKAIIYNIY